jgi:hypothetical protein
MSSTSFSVFIPKYLILFNAVSFGDCSFLVCISTTDFSELIAEFVYSNILKMETLEFFYA